MLKKFTIGSNATSTNIHTPVFIGSSSPLRDSSRKRMVAADSPLRESNRFNSSNKSSNIDYHADFMQKIKHHRQMSRGTFNN